MGVAFSLYPASSPPLREEAPGDATCCSRVTALFTFGESSTSSSESPVPSAMGVWREVGVCAGSFPVGGSGGYEHVWRPSVSYCNAALDAALDVVGAVLEVVGAVSNTMHSGGEDSRARDFPFPDAVSRSGESCRTGVRDLSGVRDRSGVRRIGDLPRPISHTLYSFALVEKSGSSPLLFRYSQAGCPPLAPQPLAGCAQLPPLLLLRTWSRLEIRVDPDTIPTSGFRRAEAISVCP